MELIQLYCENPEDGIVRDLANANILWRCNFRITDFAPNKLWTHAAHGKYVRVLSVNELAVAPVRYPWVANWYVGRNPPSTTAATHCHASIIFDQENPEALWDDVQEALNDFRQRQRETVIFRKSNPTHKVVAFDSGRFVRMPITENEEDIDEANAKFDILQLPQQGSYTIEVQFLPTEPFLQLGYAHSCRDARSYLETIQFTYLGPKLYRYCTGTPGTSIGPYALRVRQRFVGTLLWNIRARDFDPKLHHESWNPAYISS